MNASTAKMLHLLTLYITSILIVMGTSTTKRTGAAKKHTSTLGERRRKWVKISIVLSIIMFFILHSDISTSSPKIGGRRLVQIVYCFSCSSQNGTKCSQQLPALFDEDGAMWLVGGCPGVVFLCCVGVAVGTYSSRCNHVPAVKVPAVRG
jgi:hypothetical protein